MKFLRKILFCFLAGIMAVSAMAVCAGAESIENTAKTIKSGKSYTKSFSSRYEAADYKINVSSSGTLIVKIKSENKYNSVILYDSNFNKVYVLEATAITGESITANGYGTGYESAKYYWNKTGEKIVSTTKWTVKKGTYYLRIINDYWETEDYNSHPTAGKTTITATFPSSSSSSAKISYLSMTLKKGSSIQLGAVLTASTSSATKWSSSDSSVVSVTSKGKITAKKKGTAIITAKLGSSTAKLRIKVS